MPHAVRDPPGRKRRPCPAREADRWRLRRPLGVKVERKRQQQVRPCTLRAARPSGAPPEDILSRYPSSAGVRRDRYSTLVPVSSSGTLLTPEGGWHRAASQLPPCLTSCPPAASPARCRQPGSPGSPGSPPGLPPCSPWRPAPCVLRQQSRATGPSSRPRRPRHAIAGETNVLAQNGAAAAILAAHPPENRHPCACSISAGDPSRLRRP